MIVDLHAHPATKTWFGGAQFDRRTGVDKGFNPFELRCSYPSLADGGVGVLCSAVYVPEAFLKEDCWAMAFAGDVIPRLRDALYGSPLAEAGKIFTHVEEQVAAVTPAAGQPGIEVVRSVQALRAARDAGRIAVVHTVEGAHVLEGQPDHVRRLAERGVAMITLAHFYWNGVAPPVEAIPGDMFLRALGCFRYEEDLTARLPDRGRHVVEAMVEHGVLIDLTHTTRPARKDVYDLVGTRRPVIMSHVGSATLRETDLNAFEDDIDAIARCGGVIGVIFYNYWLADDPKNDTLAHVVRHVKDLVNRGGEDLVAFGSDWDGMTDPPDDLREPAEWPNLVAALEREFTSAQVEKFLGGNAMGVLERGWGAG